LKCLDHYFKTQKRGIPDISIFNILILLHNNNFYIKKSGNSRKKELDKYILVIILIQVYDERYPGFWRGRSTIIFSAKGKS